MAPYLNIFGFTLQAYGLLLLIAIWSGLWLSAREAKRLGLDGDHVYNLGLYALLAALLGARLFYVLNNWSAYQGSILAAFSLTPTAFSWPGGAVTGGLAALIYWNHHQLPLWDTLDAIVPGLALALAITRLGAFLDGSGYGEPTNLPWGVYLWGELRHPVQLYESVALLAILAFLWRRRTGRPSSGYIFFWLVALYAGSRLFLEAFRADAPLIAGGIRLVQPIALVILLGAIWYLYHRHFSERSHAVPRS